MWVYILALYSVPLIHMSVFVPTRIVLFMVVLSEIWETYAFCFAFSLRIAVALLGLYGSI